MARRPFVALQRDSRPSSQRARCIHRHGRHRSIALYVAGWV